MQWRSSFSRQIKAKQIAVYTFYAWVSKAEENTGIIQMETTFIFI